MDDRDTIGAAYLAHLTEADLRELAHAAEVSPAEGAARVQALRRVPALLLDILDRPAVSASLLNLAAPDPDQRFALISPFLTFAAAIHRIAADVRASGYAPERTTPRLRVPVFDGHQLASYLEEPGHRLFLAELLASFARSSGGVIVTQTSRGVRRRRWNDLDIGRLAMLLGALPEQDRPPVWRASRRSCAVPDRGLPGRNRAGAGRPPGSGEPREVNRSGGTAGVGSRAGRAVRVARGRLVPPRRQPRLRVGGDDSRPDSAGGNRSRRRPPGGAAPPGGRQAGR